MKIFIKTHKKRTIQLDINPEDKLEKLKTRVFEFGKKTHLIFEGFILEISKTAAECDIVEDSVLYLSECVS